MLAQPIDAKTVQEQSEVLRLLEQDTTPWYRKTNLRNLYLCLIPAALGVEMTTGYDGSVLNGLQAVSHWQTCECSKYEMNVSDFRTLLTDYVDFGHPTGALLGVLNTSYNLGSLITLPIIPWVNDTLGRKHSITIGSIVLCIGVAIQSSAINSKFQPFNSPLSGHNLTSFHSWHVHGRTFHHGHGYLLCGVWCIAARR